MNNQNAIQTSRLLSDYVNLDPRVRVLGVCLRYWARLCRIDRQKEGTLPSHAFPLLLIHFLQQEKKPVLPCIHDYLDDTEKEYATPVEKLETWKTRNDMTVAELWIEMFEYYSLGFNAEENVVSIRKAGETTRLEKQWKGKKITIEDPFSSKRSLTRLISSVSVFDYISDCFKIAYLYFGCIQTVRGPIITRIVISEASETKEDEEKKEGQLDHTKALTAEELESSILSENPTKEVSNLDIQEKIDTEATFASLLLQYGTELTPKLARKISDLVPKNMIAFQFVSNILTAGQVSSFSIGLPVCLQGLFFYSRILLWYAPRVWRKGICSRNVPTRYPSWCRPFLNRLPVIGFFLIGSATTS